MRLLEDPPGPPTMATLHIKLKAETDAPSDSLIAFADAVESVIRSIADKKYIEDISNTTTRTLEKITIQLDSNKMRERGIERSSIENLLGAAMNESVV